jgi:hypothetical protein
MALGMRSHSLILLGFQEVDLDVPADFGRGSEQSSQIPTQVAQPTKDTAMG